VRGKLLIVGLVALLASAPAAAQTQTLMPGVTYEKGIQFTPHGPVAIHVVRGPRPTGLYALRPTLSNESILGLERVTAMQKRLATTATMVGVNGDMFAGSGRPSGVLIRGGVVESPPYGDRSSVGILPDGGLDVRRVEFFGTWRGLGQRRALSDMNQSPGANGISLFTPSYGPTTPPQAGIVEAVIAPVPATAPNTDLFGPVVHIATGGNTAIPRDGVVLVARGTAAQRLTEEAPIGTTMALRIILRPEWTGVSDAIGGGPVIVRDRGPVFRSQEAFTSSQLGPRHPRTGIGQLADGRVIMVVVDGRRPGYSVGMTNFELAQALVRLGAVTGSALDAGGSSTLAFDGTLLNRPSDPGGERPVSTSLQLMYYGVFAPAPEPVISPNGDGYLETQRALEYRVVRKSRVTARLVAPGGSVAYTETLEREPGTYPIPFEASQPAEGRWRLDVSATDDLGRPSRTTQTFTVNNTLGSPSLSRRTLTVRQGGKQSIAAGVTLTRPARLTATVETASGVQVATIAIRRLQAGRYSTSWRGTTRGGTFLVYGGLYKVRFRAVNSLGTVEVASNAFRVTRAAPLKKPRAAKQRS
jgi:Phosphodiester glycosidase/FlgD Ig-like domain